MAGDVKVATVHGQISSDGVGTADFTKAGFGTVKACIVILTFDPTDNASVLAQSRASIGFSDFTNHRCISHQDEDGSAKVDCDARKSNTKTSVLLDTGGGVVIDGTASAITDGVRLTNTTHLSAAAQFATVIMFGGADLQVSLDSISLGAGTEATTVVTTGIPQDLVFFIGGDITAEDTTKVDIQNSFGVADISDDQATIVNRCMGWASDHNNADGSPASILRNDRCLKILTPQGADDWGVELTAATTTSYTVTTKDVGPGNGMEIYALALDLDDRKSKIGTADSPLSGATWAPSVSLGFTPQYVGLGLTHLPSENVISGTSNAGGHGISSNTGPGEESCHSWYNKNNAAAMVTNSLFRSRVIDLRDHEDAIVVQDHSHLSFDSGGWTYTINVENEVTVKKYVFWAIEEVAGGTTFTETMTGTIALADLVGDYGPTKVGLTPAGVIAAGSLVGATTKETRHSPSGAIALADLTGATTKETAKLHEGQIGITQLTGALSVRLAFFRLFTGLLALADLTGAYGPSKTAKGLSGATTPTGDPTLKIAATYEGATTPAGALTKFSPRAFAGAITVLTGDLILKTAKPLAGVIATITGALAQRTAKLLEGTIATAAGDLIRKTSTLLEGTLTSSGFSNHIIPLFQILVTGAITSAGAITLKTATLLEGIVSSSGALRRKISTLFEGTIALADLTGALTNVKKILIAIGGAITTLTGELLRQTQHTPSGALTSSATLTQRIAKLLEGNITPTGFSSHIIPLFKIAIGGALTLAGALIRQTQHTETASITPAGQYGPSVIRKLLEGTSTQTGDLSLTRTIVVALSGALTLAGGLIRRTAATMAGTAASSGQLNRGIAKTLTGDITPSGDLRRKASLILGAALTLAGSLATLLIPPAVAGPISRIIRHQGRAGAVIRHQGSTGRQI